jgi:hypothetical protein
MDRSRDRGAMLRRQHRIYADLRGETRNGPKQYAARAGSEEVPDPPVFSALEAASR